MTKLTKAEKELIGALKEAIKCVQWFRKQYPQEDNEGIPSEAVWLEVIARAEGRETSTEEFLMNAIAAKECRLAL